MDTVIPSGFALGILIIASLWIGRGGLTTYEVLGESWTEAEDLSDQRLNSDISISSTTSDGFDWDVIIENDGRTAIADFSGLDLVVHYHTGTQQLVQWVPYATPKLQPNSWTLLSIVGDAVEPAVVNQGEGLQMQVCLDPPAAYGTTNWLQVTTELGISASGPFTGVPVIGGCAPCTAGDTGFRSAAAEAATSGGDGNGFEQNPAGAFADGSGLATNADGLDDRHLYYDYGFAISSLCDVVGIEVRLDWWVQLLLGTNSMSVELSWDGGASWTAAKTDTQTSTIEQTVVLGGPADTWGHAWTSRQLANSKFRVRITSNCSGSPSCAVQDFFLDWVPVRVYVTPS